MSFKNILDKAKMAAVGAGAVFPMMAPFISLAMAFIPKKVAGVPAPTILAQAPGEIEQFISLATHVEGITEFAKLKGASITGQQKAEMLSSGISDVINDLELMSHHEIVDQDLLKKAMDGYAQATVDLSKALKPKG